MPRADSSGCVTHNVWFVEESVDAAASLDAGCALGNGLAIAGSGRGVVLPLVIVQRVRTRAGSWTALS